MKTTALNVRPWLLVVFIVACVVAFSARASGPPPGEGWVACTSGEPCSSAASAGVIWSTALYSRYACGDTLSSPEVGYFPEGEALDTGFTAECFNEATETYDADPEASMWYRPRYVYDTVQEGGGGVGPTDAEMAADLFTLWGIGVGALAILWGMRELVLRVVIQ